MPTVRPTWGILTWGISALGCLFVIVSGAVAPDIDEAPIHYSDTQPDDPIARLQARLDAGEASLDYDDAHGYLAAVLSALDVSAESQALVFSRTSFQQRRISPANPRAIYFGDDVYVGWVPRGDVLEFSAVDPQLGAVFYTLRQQPRERPRFVRNRDACLSCHVTSRTHDVPGHFVRSVYPAPSGVPRFLAGSYNTTHASPLAERWGGWYVTGEHGGQRHLGNVLATNEDEPRQLDVDAGANQTELPSVVRPARFLTQHSDLVALMVLEHQTQMHNLITKASYETRLALHHVQTMNAALDRPADYVDETTERRITNVCNELLDYLLFVDEAPLSEPVRGTSRFAEEFAAAGPCDDQGRSLRNLELTTRLFRRRCSYLIYSEAFDALPPPALDRVYLGLFDALAGDDEPGRCADWTPDQRQEVLGILRATKTNLPKYWDSSGDAASDRM